jgi:glycosyltransferase involved in cell wall biosynthesis
MQTTPLDRPEARVRNASLGGVTPTPPRGLRVALVDPGDFTPPYDEALARGLAEIGCHVRLWGMAGRPPADPGVVKTCHFYPLGVRLGRALPEPLRALVKGLEHLPGLSTMAGALERDGIDVLHIQWAPLPLLDRRLVERLARRVPVVHTVHDSRPYNGARRGPVVWGLDSFLGAVHALIVHTEEARERLIAAGHAPSRVHHVPHGLIDFGAVPPPRPISRERPLELLLFGAMKPYKGIDLLLAALAKLNPARRARLRVTIAGRVFMDLTPFRETIAREGLAGVVDLRPGYVPDAQVAEMVARADALLLPYRLIDASGVAMGAIASGRPVVASAIPSFAELFGNERGGILFPPEDVDALARVLADLADRPEQLEPLGRAMAALRAGFPSWVEIARRTVRVYERARETAGLWRERLPSRPVGALDGDGGSYR